MHFATFRLHTIGIALLGSAFFLLACGGGGGGGDAAVNETAPIIISHPADLTVTAGGVASFTVSATGTPAPAYEWERSHDSGTIWTPIAGSTSPIYTFTTQLSDDTSLFRAKAANHLDTATSSVAKLSVKAPGAPPAPTNLVATGISDTSISLLWTDNASSESGFRLERAANAMGPFGAITVTPTNMTTYTNTGLIAGTAYYYRVCASNASGDSAYSNTATTRTPGIPKYRLNILTSGLGSGRITSFPAAIDCGSTCYADFPAGTSVNLTAYPSTTSNFSGWTGGDSASASSCSVMMTGDRTVAASFSLQASATLTLTAPSTSSTGSYTLSWTYTGAVVPSNWLIQEDDHPTFPSPTSYSSYDTTSPYTYAFTGKADGVYYYRIGLPSGLGRSASVMVTVARPTAAILRIQNNTRYEIVDLQINGQQKLAPGYVIAIGNHADFLFNGRTTVNVALGAGFYQNGSPVTLFTYSQQGIVITPAQTFTITFPNPTLAQLLTNFSASQNWDGDYWQPTFGVKRFTFRADGSYTLYNNRVFENSGNVEIVSWPNYATFVTFRVQPGGEVLTLPYPFGQFYCHNGPVDWRLIQYTRQ